ncbi:HECT E3 ubiquitin ligase [Achlya hypogyna]|uniref:HECT E3 ubiquitin ligase n=1 Tax=Achlya hypogyna TaxID=1202772 RepID=A0A1V9YWG2_ACHHY|nr:HECT E3 ubiquitin ligase [Achlya hypogyna]
MGQTSTTGRPDARWSRVSYEQLAQDDFLTKQYRRSGFAQLYNQYDRHPLPLLAPRTDDDDAATGDDDGALGEALVVLVETDPVALAKFALQRLRDTLVHSCEYVDPFRTKLELQQYLLRCGHEALAARAAAPPVVPAPLPPPAPKGRGMPHEALLGVGLFLSLVQGLGEPELRSQLLLDLAPLLDKLAPLSLAKTADATPVLARLETFLLELCGEPALDTSTRALHALLQLALARGSVSTFLHAVRVLLGAAGPAPAKKAVLPPDDAALEDDCIDLKALRKLSRVGPLLRDTDEAPVKKKHKAPSPVHPLAATMKNNATDKGERRPRFHALDLEPVVHVLGAVKMRDAAADAGAGADDEDEREVWSCGQNSYGELSHGDTNPRKLFERVEALQGKGVVQVCAGNEHTVALAADGGVFTCGYNDNGQCGQGTTTRVAAMTEVTKLDAEFDHAVAQVHAYNGCEHTVLVAADGAAAAFGYNYRGQLGLGTTTSESVARPLRGLDGRRVRLVSCSYYHTVLSVEGDAVYAFGRNDYGQLGHNDTLDRRSPAIVDALTNVPLASLACGQYHSTVATTSGVILAFGKNDYGQLGVEGLENQLVPAVVKSGLERFVCTEVRCGYYHTIALCTGGHVYGFGRNDYGQLGLGDAGANAQQRIAMPQLIADLEGKEIVRIACGCYHTVAVAENGMLYVFGRNNHGQLGTGDATERLVPTAVDAFVGKRVAMVAAGFYHTVVLTGGRDGTDAPAADMPPTDESEAARAFTPEAVLADPSFVVGSKPRPPNKPAPSSTRSLRVLDPSFDADPEEEEQVGSPLPESNVPEAHGHLQAAVCLLAHLDRLARAFAPKRHAYPTRLAADTRRGKKADAADSRFEAYCVDVSATTFEALASILEAAADCRDGAAAQTQIYLLLASLRILQANVATLVRCGPPPDRLLEPALQKVHVILVSLVDVPKWLRDGDNTASVVDGKNQLVTEAVETLLIGFELFHSCPCSQTYLIFAILKDAAPTTAPVCACGAVGPPPMPRNRKAMLEPLLRRMTDDAVLGQFVPRSPAATADNVNALVRVLLDKIASQTAALLTKSETDELRGTDAAFRPYVVLLNAIQKHLASWAGATQQWDATAPIDVITLFHLSEAHRADVPKAWLCYIEFATAVLDHCIATLKALDLRHAKVRGDVLDMLQHSMAGQVLPALATTLLLLVDRPLFALALLPPVMELLRLVDALNQRSPKVKESERQYMEALWAYQQPVPPATASLDIVHTLHWLYALEKLLARLASAMAATLLVGDIARGPAPEASPWLANPLFAHGLEPTVFAPLTSHGRAVPHSPFPSVSGAFVVPLPPPAATDGLTLIEQLQAAPAPDGPRRFCAWIRAAYAKLDASYRFLLKAAHALDEATENAFFAVLLKRLGLASVAELWAARYAPSASPPGHLLALWHHIADLSRGFAQFKNALQNQAGAPADAGVFAQRILEATRLLFSVASDDDASVVTLPCDPVVAEDSVSTRRWHLATYGGHPFLTAFPASKWRRVRILVHTLMRWKLQRAVEDPSIGKAAVRFVLGDVDLRHLQASLLDRCRRAGYRACGLNAFSTLLAQTTLTSVQANVYECLGHSLRVALRGRVLRGLEGVGGFYEGLVRAASAQLLTQVAAALTTSLPEKDDAALFVRTPHLFSLVHCWSVAIEPGSYEFVAHIGLVQTLHRLRLTVCAALKLAKGEPLALLQRCQAALWAAMRYVFASCAARATSGGRLATPVVPLLGPCFAVLQKEVEASVATMVPSFKPDQDLGIVAPDAAVDDRLVKRSHDVLTAACTFSGLDPGVVVPHSELPLASDCADFSVSFWLYLDGARAETLPPMSKQLVFARGHASEIAPYCVVYDANDGDGTEYVLEVGIVTADAVGGDRLQAIESATSKSALESNMWYHVGIVLEGPKLRLFVNGALDVQKSLSAPVALSGRLPWHVYLGKVAAPVGDIWSLLSAHCGLEGMLAQFRLHLRALSAIHLHILYDQGPPPVLVTTDADCYHMGALVLLLAQSSEGVAVLTDRRWLRLLFWMLRGGTYRVQQLVVRILKKLLPYVAPAALPLSALFPAASEASLVLYLLRLIGFCLWRFHAAQPGAKLEYDFPLNIAAHSLSFLDYAGDNCLTADSERAMHLGMEMSDLVGALTRDAAWADLVSSELAASLGALHDGAPSWGGNVTVGKASIAGEALGVAAALGSLSVLGGSVDAVRIGALMELSQGRDLASVVAFDPTQPFAQLVLQKLETPPSSDVTYLSWVAQVHDAPPSDVWKVLRLNVDELVLAPPSAPPTPPLQGLLLATVAAMLEAPVPPSAPLGLQSHASALKALAAAVHFPEVASALLEQQPTLFQRLLALAIQSDASVTFTTLGEVELKALLLRRRLYELNASVPDVPPAMKAVGTPEVADDDGEKPAPEPESNAAGCDDDLGEDEADDDEDEDEDGDDEDDDEDDEDDAAVRPELVEELSLMGFPEDWCVMALKHTGNDILSASAWIVDNLDYFNSLQAAKDKENRQKEAQLDFNDEEDDPVEDAVGDVALPPLLAHDDDGADAFADKETGRKVFGEMYFPFEEGGFLSNCSNRFFETALGNSNAPSPQPAILEAVARFQQEVRAMAHAAVAAHALATEASLRTLYARQIVALAFAHVARRPSAPWDAWLPADDGVVLRFCKTILFRGKQFALGRVEGGGRCALEPERVVATLVAHALAHHLPRFGALLCDAIADELKGACDKRYEGYLWTQRDVHLGDGAALAEPSIEYAAWLLDQLFAAPGVFAAYLATTPDADATLRAFVARLTPCLSSSNLALKLVVFQGLTYVFRNSPNTDRAALCVAVHLSADGLLLAARRRHLREVLQNRLYFSPYLQGLLELVRAVAPHSALVPFYLQLVVAAETSLTLAWPSRPEAAVFVLEGKTGSGDFAEWYSGSDLQCTRVGLSPSTSYCCRVRCGAAVTSEIRVTTKGATEAAATELVPFMLDKKKCRSNSLTFSDDGLGVAYSGNEAWRMVLGSEGFAVGRHKWQIKIEKSSSAYLFVGVASKRANLESFLGADEHSWGFIGDGALYYQRNRLKTYGDTFGEGDVIGLDLDCEQGTLSYSKNGVDLGVAFDNVVGELFPAVAFYSRHQKVSLTTNGFDCSVGLKLHGSPKDATVDEYLGVCALMQSMLDASPLPTIALRRAYVVYTQWGNETRARCMTRAGYDLLFDVSDTTLSPFGFKARDRVKTPRGNGVVVGVADGRLWVETEAETGCWFYHPTKVRPRQINIATAVDTAPAPLAAKTPTVVAYDNFVAYADCDRWTLAQDAKLMQQLNAVCGLGGPSPWNLSQDKVKEVFRGSDTSDADLDRIVCRVALLKMLNHDISRTVAFFDLSWQYFSPAHSCLHAALLTGVKTSLFVALKHALLDSLLEKTLTHPKKAEDDYDYPEDLPQLVVNRPKAAVAHFKPDLETVVGQSLFGQAFDELHFLENKVLRMVYSHPMDDGQLRTFKVKFEGEGADDYGGPYREFFSQFMAELQSIKPDSAEATDGLECILPFLMPCPNWRNGVGSNRERFVLNPSLLRADSKWNKGSSTNPVDNSALFAEMYHFLGQILGIILRTKVLVRIDLASSIWKRLVGSSVDLLDLAEVDSVAYGLIEHLRQLRVQHRTEPEAAEATLEALDLCFTTNLSDGTLVDLVPLGQDRRVTWADLDEYLALVVEARLNEGSRAIEAIKQGLCTIVPANAVALFSWEELSVRVCGRAEIDIALLQANTEYDEDISADDAFVQRFWRVLEGMSQEDRCAFLRFVSARSRLPMDQHGFTQKFKIQAASGEGMTQNPDDSLPKSHTCFFALLLPKYSTDDICRRQFLYAIHNCLEMDGDFRLADTEMTGWNDVHPNDALRI